MLPNFLFLRSYIRQRIECHMLISIFSCYWCLNSFINEKFVTKSTFVRPKKENSKKKKNGKRKSINMYINGKTNGAFHSKLWVSDTMLYSISIWISKEKQHLISNWNAGIAGIITYMVYYTYYTRNTRTLSKIGVLASTVERF